jgi:hypothetical protein
MVATYAARLEMQRVMKETAYMEKLLEQLTDVRRGQLVLIQTFDKTRPVHLGRVEKVYLVEPDGPVLRLDDYVLITVDSGIVKNYNGYAMHMSGMKKIVTDRDEIERILQRRGKSLGDYKKAVSDYKSFCAGTR